MTVPKGAILCAFSKCIEIEGSVSLKLGTGKISRDETDKPKLKFEPTSTKGKVHITIVDKLKKKP